MEAAPAETVSTRTAHMIALDIDGTLARCLAPGLMEALISGKDESYGCTEEVSRGASGASGPDGGGLAEGPGYEAWRAAAGG
jgi:hypothetical protein